MITSFLRDLSHKRRYISQAGNRHDSLSQEITWNNHYLKPGKPVKCLTRLKLRKSAWFDYLKDLLYFYY